jgi:hypothetical protein
MTLTCVLLLLTFFWGFWISNLFSTITSILGLIGSVITYRDVSERFKRFLLKSRVVLLNKQIAWSLEADFINHTISYETFLKIKDYLQQIGENRTIFNDELYQLSMSIDGVVLQLTFQQNNNEDIFISSELNGSISLFFPEYHAPYLESNVLLENHVFPILNNIKSKIGQSEESFRFHVFFKNQNPFIGLYLKDLSSEEKFTFMCNFQEKNPILGIEEENLINISQKSLKLSTKNLYSLNRLIHKHLFLAGRN